MIMAMLIAVHTLKAQDVLDIIAEKTCTCLSDIDSGTAIKDLETQMGLCMIKNAEPFEKELKKQYHISFSELSTEKGTEFGTKLGIRMVSKCPVQLMRFSQKVSDQKKGRSISEENTFTGTITDMQSNQFNTLIATDAKGREYRFLWLSYFKGSENLTNGIAGIKGISFDIKYVESEYYSPVLNDYVKFRVLTGLKSNKE